MNFEFSLLIQTLHLNVHLLIGCNVFVPLLLLCVIKSEFFIEIWGLGIQYPTLLKLMHYTHQNRNSLHYSIKINTLHYTQSQNSVHYTTKSKFSTLHNKIEIQYTTHQNRNSLHLKLIHYTHQIWNLLHYTNKINTLHQQHKNNTQHSKSKFITLH